jgi:enamine deaminase RidA (YjgF/YER057c/UK114 family)
LCTFAGPVSAQLTASAFVRYRIADAAAAEAFDVITCATFVLRERAFRTQINVSSSMLTNFAAHLSGAYSSGRYPAITVYGTGAAHRPQLLLEIRCIIYTISPRK